MNQIIKITLLIVIIFTPFINFAHVGYVISPNEMYRKAGIDFSFLLSPLSDFLNIGLIITTIIIVILIYVAFRHNLRFIKWSVLFQKRISDYLDFIHLIIRLGLGTALIGTGNSQVLISPVITDEPMFSFVQILL